MDGENIVQHINMSCITKKPFLPFPEPDNEAIIFIFTFMSCQKNTHPINFSFKMFYEGFFFFINCFSTLDICVSSLPVFCSGVAASLPTCRPAERVRRLSDILAHRISPTLLLHLPPPSRHAFPLHQGWHHHGGTQGPPHLLPITASQTPPRKRLQTVMKPRGTTWDPEKTNRWPVSPPAGRARCGSVWDHPTTFCFKFRRQQGLEDLICGSLMDVGVEM